MILGLAEVARLFDLGSQSVRGSDVIASEIPTDKHTRGENLAQLYSFAWIETITSGG